MMYPAARRRDSWSLFRFSRTTVQVLLVTGGLDSSNNRLSSTELLLPSATSWSYSGALPSPRNLLKGATLDNKVLVTGTNIESVVIYFKNITIHYTMQGAWTGMASNTMMCWSMTSRRENGTRLGPCQSSGASMPLLS